MIFTGTSRDSFLTRPSLKWSVKSPWGVLRCWSDEGEKFATGGTKEGCSQRFILLGKTKFTGDVTVPGRLE